MKKLIIFIVFNLISVYVNAETDHKCFGRYKVDLTRESYIEVVVRSKEEDANKACSQISKEGSGIVYASKVNVMDKFKEYNAIYNDRSYFDCSIDKRLLPINIITAPKKFQVSSTSANNPRSQLDYCIEKLKDFGLSSGEFRLECNEKCEDFRKNMKRLGCNLNGDTCEKGTCLFSSPNCLETEGRSCDLGYKPEFLNAARKVVICVKSDTSVVPTVFQTDGAR